MFSTDQWDPDRMMDGSYAGGMMGGGFWMMAIFGLLLLVLAGTTIFLAIKALSSSATDAGQVVGSGTGRPEMCLIYGWPEVREVRTRGTTPSGRFWPVTRKSPTWLSRQPVEFRFNV